MATTVALLGTGLATLAPAALALAPTVTNSPPVNGHSLIVFPDRDFVHGDGWPQGAVLTAEVLRNNVVIATSNPINPKDDPTTAAFDGMFDLNHLGEPCWNTTTPDILPGDVIRLTDQNGIADATPTADVQVTQGATNTGGVITVRGTAADAAGLPLPTNTFEARLVANKQLFSNGKRTLRATPVYDAGSTNWTATWSGLPAGDQTMATDTSVSRVLWLGRAPGASTFLGSPIESTISEFGAIGGPAGGCTAPAARYAVTTSSPAALNIATNAGDLTLSGVSQNATAVTVTLADSTGTATPAATATVTPVPSSTTGAQTWSALIPAADHNLLAPGTLTATASYTIPNPAGGTTTIGGTSRTLLKDIVAPATPTATPPGGTYPGTQSVTLSSPDNSPIFFTVDGSTPTPASPRYTTQISVTAAQTIKAISQDAAGNLSPVATNAYVLGVPPAAPTAGPASAGNTTASLSWTAAADNGFAVTGYTLRAFAAGATAPSATLALPGTATSGTVTGLSNGTAYTLDVFATNAGGNGPPSTRSSAVVPATVPDAPTIGTATAGDASATVTWTAPAADGGSAVTGYWVQAFNGATGAPVGAPRPAPAGATSLVATGLANGTAYDFEVTAQNAMGSSPASGRSNSVTPIGLPGAPTGVTAARGNARATVSWTPPVNNGGSAITGYTVQALTAGSVAASATAGALTTSVDVTGLTNGTAYTVTVTATNSLGSGAASAASAAVTPATVPDAPTAVTGAPLDSSVKVSWTAAGNGGSAVGSYSVRAFSAGVPVSTTTSAGPGTSFTVTGLTNGTPYTFDVTATNGVGVGPASAASAAVTPIGAPGAPTGVTATAGNASASVSWTAPASNGGSAVTGYTLKATSSAGVTTTPLVGTATSTTITGLTNGTAYTFTVAASNATVTGAFSAASAAVTPVAPATAPGAPTGVVAKPADASATVTWTAPVSDGGSAITGYSVRAFNNGTGIQAGLTQPAAATARSLVFPNLVNGTAYTFEVLATNGASLSSVPSLRSAPVTPVAAVTAPGAPTGVTGTRGDANVLVKWVAPLSTGSSAITGYSVRAFAGTTLVSTTPVATPVLSVTVGGLANGTAYTFDVAAKNTVFGAVSTRSPAVTPATLAGAPTGVTAATGNASALVTWVAPASTGGTAITSHSLRAFGVVSGLQVGATKTAAASARSLVVTGLVNGTAYTVDVRAVNAVGTGPASARSLSVTPAATAPLAPVVGAVTAGNASAKVSWTASGTGGSAITSYVVNAYTSAGTVLAKSVTGVPATSRYVVVPGLLNATSYTFRVRAVNAVGTSPSSALSAAAVPSATLPLSPVIGVATSGVVGDVLGNTATAAWSAPVGGPAVTGYEVTALQVTAAGTIGTRTVAAIQGSGVRSLRMVLAAGSYRFEVRAVAAGGNSTPSAMSNKVTAQ